MASQIQDVKNVLFVDDEPSVVNSLRLLFRRVKSLHVYTTTNQQEAIKLVEQLRIHVVVSDMKMPGMSGAELLSEVKKRSPNTLRILLTGYAEMTNIIKSINKGEVYRFLEKPWINRDLKKKVLQAVDISETLWRKNESWQTQTTNRTQSNNDNPQSLALKTETRVSGSPQISKETIPDQAVLFIGHPESNVHLLLKQRFNMPIYHASNAQRALVRLLNYPEITTIIAHADKQYRDLNRYSHFADIASLFKTLKSIFPMLVTLVITDERDSRIAISLVNEAQIFRYLSPPLCDEHILRDTRDALQYAQMLKIDPILAKQHAVEEMADTEKQSFTQRVDFSLFERMKTRFQQFFSHFRLGTMTQ